jgi:cystathionine gamma-synthase
MIDKGTTRHKPSRTTLAVWAGEDNAGTWKRATQIPVVHSVSYGYRDIDHWYDVAVGEVPGHIYSRNSNPTVAVFERKLRELEGAEAATSFSTGMAAISNTLHALLKPGDRVVSVKDTYGGTNEIFSHFLPRWHVDVTLCSTTDHEEIEAQVAQGCQVLYLETPTNPTLKVVDLERLAAAGHRVGGKVVVDNTFATPINTNPLTLGCDLVIHSATKFLGGHADALGGVVCGDEGLIENIFRYREINGASMHPMAAYFMIRGMKTLALRVERQNQNALTIARFLKEHPFVEDVYYPGLETHLNHQIAKRQMRGYGWGSKLLLEGRFRRRAHIPAAA